MNVVFKGQHVAGQTTPVKDFVRLADQTTFWLTQPYVPTDRVNGTGDSFSAIIAAELAKGATVAAAIRRANELVHAAIANGLTVGHQYGPINHWAAMTE